MRIALTECHEIFHTYTCDYVPSVGDVLVFNGPSISIIMSTDSARSEPNQRFNVIEKFYVFEHEAHFEDSAGRFEQTDIWLECTLIKSQEKC